MKKYLFMLSLWLIILLTLTSCTKDEPSTSPELSATPTAISSEQPSNTPEIVTTPETPENVLKYVPIDPINLELPTVPRYTPEIKVVPLTNTPVIYTMIVEDYGQKNQIDSIANVQFVDKNGEKIKTDRTVTGYYLAEQTVEIDGTLVQEPQCYLIFDEQGYMAVMRLDGTVVTDFIYEMYYVGEDIPAHEVRDGYVVVCEPISGLCGLVNIETGELVIDCLYKNMFISNGFAYAEKDETAFVLDFQGEILHDLGKPTQDYDKIIRTNELSFTADNYRIFDAAPLMRGLIKSNYPENINMQYMGLFQVVSAQYDETSQVVVYVNDGEYVTHFDGYQRIIEDELNVIIQYGEKVAVITENKEIIEFNVAEEYIYEASFNDGLLTVVTDATFETIYDQNGKISTEEKFESSVGISYTNEGCGYLDKNNKIIIEYGKYERLRLCGNFIIAENHANGQEIENYEMDIYNINGDLLAQDPYGAVYEIGFEDKMVIYTDENNCKFLFLNGQIEDIQAANPVIRHYVGG